MSNERPLLEALTYSLEHRLTFVVFRVPGGPITLWAQQTPFVDHVENGLWWEMNDVFLLSPFIMPGKLPLVRSDVELTFGDAEPAWHRLMECVGSTAPHGRDHAPSTTDRSAFEKAVRTAKALCQQGDLEKAVLSRTVDLPVGAADAPQLFIDAVLARPKALVTLLSTPEHGVWLGASPERLINAEYETLHVDALAGTMPSEKAPDDPTLWGEKELHEQRVVTKTIVGTLIDQGVRSVSLEGPTVMHTAGMAHLHTRITATVEGRSIGDLVSNLHPTPAVCGIPTDKARIQIAAMEGRDRELYAGFWGPWSADGRMELFVNIRCMRLFNDHAELHVGAGITAGSEPALEWLETEHKAEGWRKLLPTLSQ